MNVHLVTLCKNVKTETEVKKFVKGSIGEKFRRFEV